MKPEEILALIPFALAGIWLLRKLVLGPLWSLLVEAAGFLRRRYLGWRARRALLWSAASSGPSLNPPPPPAAQRRAAAPALPPAEAELPVATATPPTTLFTATPPEVRQHTAIGARPGDGKTQTGISLMVQDIARGADVYWLNPQLTLHHAKDQPIDLHPIGHLFTQIDDYKQIMAVLEAAYQLGVQRKPLYKEGKDVGHNVVLHLDEWPAIFAELGEPVIALIERILRECRKLNIWVVLGAQDFLVDTTGFNSGVRAAFVTKLVGNVDETTWRTLLGTGQKKAPVAKGTWMTDDGLVQVVRPSAAMISRLATMPRRSYVGQLAAAAPAPVSSVSAQTPEQPVGEGRVSDEEVQRFLDFVSGPLSVAPLSAQEAVFRERYAELRAAAEREAGVKSIIPAAIPAENTAPKLTKGREKAIRDAAAAGLSRNVMAGLIGGDKGRALALIAEVLGPAETEKPLQAEE